MPKSVADQRIANVREYCRRNPRRITPRNSISSSTGATTHENSIGTMPGAIVSSKRAMSSAFIGNSHCTSVLSAPARNTSPGMTIRIGTVTSVIVAVSECPAG
jgi:hypothetical protein